MGKSKRQGRRWYTPRNRHPYCLCQELFKPRIIWSHLHVQLSHTQQDAGLTDLWGGQVSYNWWCPHRTQYVYFICVSYHGHCLVIRNISNGLMDPCVCADLVTILWDLEKRWIEQIDDNVRRILCIGAMLDPHLKTIKDTAPEFTENMLDMDSVFEFELLVRWVPKDLDTVCSVAKDTSIVTATNNFSFLSLVHDVWLTKQVWKCRTGCTFLWFVTNIPFL